MLGFPQPSSNPHHAMPRLFASCYAAWDEVDLTGAPKCALDSPRQSEAVLACVFAWDPSRERHKRKWPHPWSAAMQMCDWQGGEIDADTLDDFVVFGLDFVEWMAGEGASRRDPTRLAQLMAEASMDFLSFRFGAPIGPWSSLAWISKGPLASRVLDQASTAKRLLLAQWEADQMSACCVPGFSGRPARL